jgi:drug/metabolite transporter (DMT)-like permease
MHEYATKFADLLEEVARKIRTLTVDRVRYGIKMTGLGILTATLAFTAVIFLLWAVFGALEIPLSTAGAFAVLGALLLIGGGILWFKRIDEE